MMKTLALAAILAAFATLPDRAMAETRTYDLSPFQFVSVSAGITAIITAGQPQSVQAEAPSQADLSRLRVEVRDNRLEIGMEGNVIDFLFNFGRHPPIVVRVSAPVVLGIDASSGANVDAKSVGGDHLTLDASSGAALVVSGVTGGVLKANASSGAGVEVSGTCADLSADASSGGHVRAGDLHCARLDASASSGGNVTAFATASAEARASSGGGITVLGNPATVDRQSSSGGWVNMGQ